MNIEEVGDAKFAIIKQKNIRKKDSDVVGITFELDNDEVKKSSDVVDVSQEKEKYIQMIPYIDSAKKQTELSDISVESLERVNPGLVLI